MQIMSKMQLKLLKNPRVTREIPLYKSVAD
jgi:hypothetical protein